MDTWQAIGTNAIVFVYRNLPFYNRFSSLSILI